MKISEDLQKVIDKTESIFKSKYPKLWQVHAYTIHITIWENDFSVALEHCNLGKGIIKVRYENGKYFLETEELV